NILQAPHSGPMGQNECSSRMCATEAIRRFRTLGKTYVLTTTGSVMLPGTPTSADKSDLHRAGLCSDADMSKSFAKWSEVMAPLKPVEGEPVSALAAFMRRTS